MVDELNITRKSPYNEVVGCHWIRRDEPVRMTWQKPLKTLERYVYDLRNSLVKGWLDISHRMKFLVDFALFEFFLV